VAREQAAAARAEVWAGAAGVGELAGRADGAQSKSFLCPFCFFGMENHRMKDTGAHENNFTAHG
jgi:hypothetical protein